jgi:uncharacterized damage-inducible protein DinB
MRTHPESTLVELIRYHNWANAQILATCQELNWEQLTASAPGTYGPIIATLWHMILSEADYVGRLTGPRLQPSISYEEDPGLSNLSPFADQVAGALLDTIQRISPDQMVHEEEDGNTMDYKARALFIQIVNHGIEHRTNITTILSGLGLPAPEVDGWGYLFAHPDQFALKEESRESPNADPQA